MRIHRVYTSAGLEPGAGVALEGQQAHYLGRVLRVAQVQRVVLFNGDGRDYVCEIHRAGKNSLELEVMSRLPARAESPLGITVVQAVSRGERMDQTLQKCTELGAVAFQPLWSDRVEVKLKGEKLDKRQRHWQSVVVSACEQSGRAVVPEVRPALSLAEYLSLDCDASRLVLAPGAGQALSRLERVACVDLLVGPEGGFSDNELSRASDSGVTPVSLGPRILRTETAAPAAVAVLQAGHGDL